MVMPCSTTTAPTSSLLLSHSYTDLTCTWRLILTTLDRDRERLPFNAPLEAGVGERSMASARTDGSVDAAASVLIGRSREMVSEFRE